MTPSKQIIEVIYRMLDEGNLSRILPMMDEQAVIYIPDTVPFGGEFHGRSGFLTMMSGLYKFSDTLRPRSLSYFRPDEGSLQNAFVTTGQFEGRLRRGGQPIVLPFIHYWLLKDEKVTSLRTFYWDTAALLHLYQAKGKGFDPSSNGLSAPEKDDLSH